MLFILPTSAILFPIPSVFQILWNLATPIWSETDGRPARILQTVQLKNGS
jgi:hypothetical protein